MTTRTDVRVAIEVAGAPLPAALAAAVTTVDVDQQLGSPAQCRVALAVDPTEAEALGLGSTLGIRLSGHDTALFEGEITGRERSWHSDRGVSLVVRAHDGLFHLRAERRTASYTNLSVVDVARELASRHGLDVECSEDASTQPLILQYGETDLALLRRLCARAGLFATVRGSTLHLVTTSGLGDALQIVPGQELLELSIDVRRDPSPEAIRVVGADLLAAESVIAGTGSPYAGWLVDGDQATDLARSLSARAAASAMVATGVAVGDPTLRPATVLSFGSGVPTDTAPVIASAQHRIDPIRGYLTEFCTEITDRGLAPAPAALTLGSVVDVDDPEAAGRVRVSLSAFEDLETSWLPVVSAGAGADKGVIVLPDVDDTVLLAGPADDPGRSVVLGGLWGSTDPYGTPIVGGRSRRYVARMPGGGHLLIDDEDDTVRIGNGAGSQLELRPDLVRLFADTDLVIDAPGRRVRIRADAIDMERA